MCKIGMVPETLSSVRILCLDNMFGSLRDFKLLPHNTESEYLMLDHSCIADM